MREVKRKNPASFGYSELTRRVFLVRGGTQEDVTDAFKEFTEPMFNGMKSRVDELAEENTRMREALAALADGHDEPEMAQGLAYGLEDAGLQENGYAAAEYGWNAASYQYREWIAWCTNRALKAREDQP